MVKSVSLLMDLMAQRLNTVYGILSDLSLLLPSLVVLTMFTLLLERRSFISVLPLVLPFPMLLISLVLKVLCMLSNSLIDLVVI